MPALARLRAGKRRRSPHGRRRRTGKAPGRRRPVPLKKRDRRFSAEQQKSAGLCCVQDPPAPVKGTAGKSFGCRRGKGKRRGKEETGGPGIREKRGRAARVFIGGGVLTAAGTAPAPPFLRGLPRRVLDRARTGCPPRLRHGSAAARPQGCGAKALRTASTANSCFSPHFFSASASAATRAGFWLDSSKNSPGGSAR